MDRNEIPYDERHQGDPLGASKMISKPMVHSTQMVHLSCVKISTLQTDQIELPLEPRHLGVPSDASKTISKPVVYLAQTVHQSNTVSKWTEMRFRLTHVT